MRQKKLFPSSITSKGEGKGKERKVKIVLLRFFELQHTQDSGILTFQTAVSGIRRLLYQLH